MRSRNEVNEAGIKSRRVCIIGAGPSGLAAARYLIAESHFTAVDVFEQRPTVGGVWNINKQNVKPTPVPSEEPFWDNLDIPSASTNGTAKEQHGESNGAKGATADEVTEFDSPLYPTLETNIPHQIMAYSNFSFVDAAKDIKCEGEDISDPSPPHNHLDGSSPAQQLPGSASTDDTSTSSPPHIPLYPFYPTVLNYIRDYSRGLIPNIHFSTQIVSASFLPSTDHWLITTHDPVANTQKDAMYDYLIVANGHYTTPYLPSIPGIKEFHAAYPDVISHSRDFRTVDPFRGKKTVVIGASASGLDIGMQIEEVCQQPLIRVIRSGNRGDNPHSYKTIEAFLPEERGVKFTDVHGNVHIETGIEKVLFATGYLYSFPFFQPELQDELVGQTSGLRVAGLYKQIFLRRHPNCAFMVLPLRVVPFPLAEAQAAVVARVWAGRLELPSHEEMEKEEREMVEDKGDGKAFHTLPWPEDVDYMNGLVEWARQAKGDAGLMPGTWNEEVRWLRKQFPEIRRRYKELGDKRGSIERWEELGIDYKEEEKMDAREQGQVSG